MSHKAPERPDDRRAFLKTLAAAGGATALVAVTGRTVAETAEPDAAPEKPKPRGYHETPHINTYYRKARL